MTRRPVFWILLAALAILGGAWSLRVFPKAFPIVSLDLRMDRAGALAAAEQLARANGWPPDTGYRQAASFGVDREVQTFVELEGGGKPAFNRMVAGNLYSPFTWDVRHFREGFARETTVRFTPAGVPYGFQEHLEEKAPGPTIARDSARAIAERVARERWRIDFTQYELVESGQETQAGGRTDHTFVYERPERDIGEGRYRLRLVVAGDRLTELTRLVKVPEAFSRRYAEMRSANNGIAAGSAAAMLVLYGIGGIGIGLFYLMRRRWVLWRPALRWGAAIGFLQALAALSDWPLRWFEYDTAVPVRTFMAQGVLLVLGTFAGMTVLLTLTFAAAEGLGRRAFGSHPQFWKVWQPPAAASPQIGGRTAGGYLLVPLFFAYQMALGFFATRNLGWWNPSDALIEPNLLASYLPWVSAVAPSLQAGFWEECLFRAVPLASAALIGDRLGNRKAWIASAFVLQALIFGAGHANYPAQPAYARLVELTLPSFVFGGLYLAYGLLPGIVMHFVYDLVWFAIPLFVAFTPGIWIDRTLLVLCGLVPAGVLLLARVRQGAWLQLPTAVRNAAWAAPDSGEPPAPPLGMPQELAGTRHILRPRLIALGFGAPGLVALAIVARVTFRLPTLATTRSAALAIARDTLAARGAPLGDGWEQLASVEATPGDASRFVWQTAGPGVYRQLLGTYLPGPGWQVRSVRFTGDVVERAEEWQVALAADGHVLAVTHVLPEARPAPSVDEATARAMALTAIQRTFGLGPDQLRPVSATPAKLAGRTDWTLVFADTTGLRLPQGDKWISVTVGGNAVTGARRMVHASESWERTDREARSIERLLGAMGSVLLGGLLLGGAGAAVAAWSRRRFPAPIAIRMFLGLALVLLVSGILGWPAQKAAFDTSQPLRLMVGLSALGVLLQAVIPAGILALVLGLGTSWMAESGGMPHRLRTAERTMVALGIALAAAGLTALLGRVGLARAVSWPAYSPAGDYVPWVATALTAVVSWAVMTAVLLMLFGFAHRITGGWTRKRGIGAALLLGAGAALGGVAGSEIIPTWLLTGAIAGGFVLLVYVAVVRLDLAIVPLAAAGLVILKLLQVAYVNPYPGAAWGALFGSLFVGWLGRTLGGLVTGPPLEPG